ncbi:hypothetical protein CMV_017335 [Castanea mollissima]|uniref:Uncharacterized protein n=1 Tax=Castanea mollissima TaxID=60419 RepID=A0A8J4VH95_9ROSI|nr:hypothetical protein CMV_017335 [Castanea mollissima]
MESPSSKQFFVASLFIVLAICSYMNSRLAATLNQLSSEFITTSVALTISPTTGDSRINIEKSFATKIITTSAPNTNIPDSTCTSTNHTVAPAPSPETPVLRRKLLKGHTPPSAPNPAGYIPPSTSSSTNHKAAPAPSPEFPVLGRKLLKGHTRPSAPNPAGYIPPSTSSSTNHKAAPAPSPEFPVLGPKLLKGHTPPSAPNPATYIPPSTSSSTNHKAAPAPSPGTVL